MTKWGWYSIAFDVLVIAAFGWIGVAAVAGATLWFHWTIGRHREASHGC